MRFAEKTKKWVTTVAGLLFYSMCISGQEYADSVPAQGFSQDTVIILQPPEKNTAISAAAYPSAEDSYRQHSPAKATIMSAVLPGMGQIYNKKIWKLPIVYAAIGTTTYIFLKWQNQYQRHRKAYVDFNDGDPTTNYYNEVIPVRYSNDASRYLTHFKDVYHRYRDWAILAVVIAYGLNIIDANVDAHFFDYSIDDNISLNFQPCFLENGMYSQKIALNLRFTF
jgi:hypothetical protein